MSQVKRFFMLSDPLPIANRPVKLEVIFCVQAVVSPLLANLYMNRFLKYWRITGRGERFQAQVVTYADDFVVLSRGYAPQARDWVRQVMSRMGLTLNEAKTSIRRARQERFDFLGYTFGPYRYRKDGHWYLGTGPSKKSISRLRQKVTEVLKPSNVQPWEEVDRKSTRLNSSHANIS